MADVDRIRALIDAVKNLREDFDETSWPKHLVIDDGLSDEVFWYEKYFDELEIDLTDLLAREEKKLKGGS